MRRGKRVDSSRVSPGVPVFSVGKDGRLFFWAVWQCAEDVSKSLSLSRPLRGPIAHGQCSSIEEGTERALAVQPFAVRIHNSEAHRWQAAEKVRRAKLQRLLADTLSVFQDCEENELTLDDVEQDCNESSVHEALQLARRVGSVASLRAWGLAVGVALPDESPEADEEGYVYEERGVFDSETVGLPEDHYAMVDG